MSEGYVYFLGCDSVDAVKIGYGRNPSRRLSYYSRWCPFQLTVLAAIKADRCDERRFHRLFAKDHSHGEWFKRSAAIDAAIAQITAGHPITDILAPSLISNGSVVDNLTAKFGTQKRVAQAAECSQQSVAEWRTARFVPSKRIELLLKNAPQFGVVLTADEFFNVPREEATA